MIVDNMKSVKPVGTVGTVAGIKDDNASIIEAPLSKHQI